MLVLESLRAQKLDQMRILKEKKEEEESAGMYKPSFGTGNLGAVFNVGVDNEAQARMQRSEQTF